MLAGVLVVGDAVLNTLGGRIPEINQERNHREDEHAEDLKRKNIKTLWTRKIVSIFILRWW